MPLMVIYYMCCGYMETIMVTLEKNSSFLTYQSPKTMRAEGVAKPYNLPNDQTKRWNKVDWKKSNTQQFLNLPIVWHWMMSSWYVKVKL